MLSSILNTLKTRGKDLAVTAALFDLLTFIALAPLLALLFRLFISLSGRTVLADTDMLLFFLHPLGWLAAVSLGGVSLGILAVQQAALIGLALDREATPMSAIMFAGRRARPIVVLTSKMIGLSLLLAVPFLSVGGLLYWLLLTKHDINFYLTEHPPEFWWAVVLIGAVLLALVVVQVLLWLRWTYVLPLVLFEGQQSGSAMQESRQRATGRRRQIAGIFAGWAAAMIALSLVATSAVGLIGRLIVPHVTGSIGTLLIVVGAVATALTVVDFLLSLLSRVSFGLVLTDLYVRSPESSVSEVQLPAPDDSARAAGWLTWRKTVWAVVGATAVSAIVGLSILETIELEDRAEIIAHRGASMHAPENTLAAVERAIADGADWVEIDVQESADGVVVVVHDSDLKKLAGVDFKIWDATLEEIQAVDVGSGFADEFAGERVPTLDEVLAACQGRVRVNIELKYYGHDERLEERVAEIVEAHGMEDDIVVMSLKYEAVRKMKALRPEWRVGLLSAVAAGDLSRVEADFLAVNTSLATPALIQATHNREKLVYVWTVNDALTMSAMMGLGVDGIITDDPALARRVLEFRADLNPLERVLLDLAPLLGTTPNDVGELRP